MFHRVSIASALCTLSLAACAAEVPGDTESDLALATETDADIDVVAQAGTSGTVTLTANTESSGFDFSAGLPKGNSGGDFYYVSNAFWANNLGQRGIVALGPCASLSAVKTVPAGGYWRAGTPAVAGNCYVSLTHFEEKQNIIFRVRPTPAPGTSVTIDWKSVADCFGLTDYRAHVSCWLSKNGAVAKRLIWEQRSGFATSTPIAWAAWPNTLRDELREQVFEYLPVASGTSTYEAFPLAEPLVNQEVLGDEARVEGVLSEADARTLYVKTIAMSLAVELRAAVPWSITGYSAIALAGLFDSRNTLMYTWPGKVALPGAPTPAAEGYLLVTNAYDYTAHTTLTRRGAVVSPAPPIAALTFLRGKSLLGATRQETIEKLLAWTVRMHHFDGSASFETKHFARIWQYRGPTPVTRMIGTTIDPMWSPDPLHYTAGCHGTAGFLHAVLRMVNIPVDANVNTSNGHSLPRFTTEALTMSHGDDPYMGFDFYDVPVRALLLDDTTYRAWYVTASPTLAAENVGRAVAQSEIDYRSTYLRFRYCLDAPGTPHASSQVFVTQPISRFPSTYTLGYLENLPPSVLVPSLPPSLWDRLALKIGAGGCQAEQAAFNQQLAQCEATLPVAERQPCTWN